MAHIVDLPPELHLSIVHHIDLPTFSALRQTCRKFNTIWKTESAWKDMLKRRGCVGLVPRSALQCYQQLAAIDRVESHRRLRTDLHYMPYTDVSWLQGPYYPLIRVDKDDRTTIYSGPSKHVRVPHPEQHALSDEDEISLDFYSNWKYVHGFDSNCDHVLRKGCDPQHVLTINDKSNDIGPIHIFTIDTYVAFIHCSGITFCYQQNRLLCMKVYPGANPFEACGDIRPLTMNANGEVKVWQLDANKTDCKSTWNHPDLHRLVAVHGMVIEFRTKDDSRVVCDINGAAVPWWETRWSRGPIFWVSFSDGTQVIGSQSDPRHEFTIIGPNSSHSTFCMHDEGLDVITFLDSFIVTRNCFDELEIWSKTGQRLYKTWLGGTYQAYPASLTMVESRDGSIYAQLKNSDDGVACTRVLFGNRRICAWLSPNQNHAEVQDLLSPDW